MLQIAVLGVVGVGLMVKLVFHLKKWWATIGEIKKQRKLRNAQKMRKRMLEEYKAGMEPEAQEGNGKEIPE